MKLSRLWLNDFRTYTNLELPLVDGLTAIVGPNGSGKTNLIEAMGLLAMLKSFRGAPTESLIRKGADRAVVRAEGERDGRPVLIELELSQGRTRAQVNRQRLARSRDLLGALRVTVFAPDDLALVKDGPAVRREFLDDLVVSLQPSADLVCSDFDRVVRQRNALLKNVPMRNGRPALDDTTSATLDVWDQQFAALGEQVLELRYEVLADLVPLVGESYVQLAGRSAEVIANYRASWGNGSLAAALDHERLNDLRRKTSTVGPHRDEISVYLNGFASRTEASQGEQRTLALALRLAGHRLVSERIGEPPLLLLDDVFSELDETRSRALLDSLVSGQTIITTASELPPGTVPDQMLRHTGAELRLDSAASRPARSMFAQE
ncbi:MAG: DNA replication/repair protein RecF [Actinomycetota bacterium]|nr:DNA replication/repair protein RecF [Actinomycetota bacterium]